LQRNVNFKIDIIITFAIDNLLQTAKSGGVLE